eukprot:Awhi_evm1s15219
MSSLKSEASTSEVCMDVCEEIATPEDHGVDISIYDDDSYNDSEQSEIKGRTTQNIGLDGSKDVLLMSSENVYQIEQRSTSTHNSKKGNDCNTSVDVIITNDDDRNEAFSYEKRKKKSTDAATLLSGKKPKMFLILGMFVFIFMIIGTTIGVTVGVTKILQNNDDGNSNNQDSDDFFVPDMSHNDDPAELALSDASYERVLVFGMMSLNDIDNLIDIAEVFPDSQNRGCTSTIRDGRVCTGTPNIRSVKDPNGHHEKVLEVGFKKDTYGVQNGAQFYTDLNDMSSNEAVLTYYMRFSKDFDFKKGGKIPGLHGGSMECSGGRKATGTNCWSARLMWRAEGNIETYFYTPIANATDNFCQNCGRLSGGYKLYNTCSEIVESTKSYCSFAKTTTYKLVPDKWIYVEQRVKLNTPGKTNGVYQLKVDGVQRGYSDEVVYRTTSDLGIGGLFFSTFFGGATQDWAPSKDQQIYFKKFKVFEKRWVMNDKEEL